MKKSIFLCISILLIFTCYSQAAHSPFTIESYIPELFTDKVWTVGGNFRLSANSSDNVEFESGLDFDNSTSTKYDFGVNSSFSYQYQTIPEYFQMKIRGTAGFNSNSADSENYNENLRSSRLSYYRWNKREQKMLDLSLTPSITYGKYLKDDFFTQLSFMSAVDIDHSFKNNLYNIDSSLYDLNDAYRTSYRNEYSEGNRTLRHYSTRATLSTGIGRIYSGRYAAIILYIIRELRDKNLLLTEPDSGMLRELTEIYYQLSNKHTIDIRLKEIELIDSMVTHLVNNKIIEPDNRYASLIVNDIYNYYPRADRSFGFKCSIGFGFEYRYLSNKNNSDVSVLRYDIIDRINSPVVDTQIYYNDKYESYMHLEQEELSKNIFAQIEYDKPISEVWQVNTQMNGSYYFDSYRIDKIYETEVTDFSYNSDYSRTSIDYLKNYRFQTSISSLYILSTRTIFNSSISYQYRRYQEERDERSRNDKNWYFRLSSSLEYRIAIPTNLIVNSTYVQNNEYTTFSLSGSIRHYIY